MWTDLLPSGAALPTGLWSFDALLLTAVMATAIVLIVAVLGFTLARMTHDRREVVMVPCPKTRRNAIVVLHRPIGLPSEVEHCSLWHRAADRNCDRSCIRMAA